MDTVNKMTVCLCAVSVLCAALNILAPMKDYGKLLKPIFGLFVVLCIFKYTLCIIRDFSLPSFDISDTSVTDNESITNGTANIIKRYAEGSIESILQSEKIDNYNITVYTDIDKDGSISISKAIVEIKNCNEIKSLEELIYNKTGIKVKIVSGG